MRQISNPARSSGVATARIPRGAVASELANDGKKKTILRDLDNGFSSLKRTIDTPQDPVVTGMSAICQVSAATPISLLPALGRAVAVSSFRDDKGKVVVER